MIGVVMFDSTFFMPANCPIQPLYRVMGRNSMGSGIILFKV